MLTGNFILYLAVQFVMQFIPNIIVSVKVDKEFPCLKECRELPEKEEFHGILRNIGAMSFHKLGTVIVRNTDSLLMVQKFGVAGILGGTVISTVTTCLWMEPYILMRYGIREDWQGGTAASGPSSRRTAV
ncbi:MAG: hypothetical protein MR452_04055 [Faecalibacterium prausnitzii]|nr:hypothetical protein [Faecalibacterium prausnitzii]